MEMKLLELDEADAEEPNARFLRCRALDNNRDEPERAELINKIDKKLQEYDDIVLRHRKMASLPKATTRNYNSLANWMLKWKPLASKEAKFIERDQDFVALVDEKEGSWFDALIEDFLGHLHRPLARSIFSDHAQRISSEDDDLDLYSKSRIDIFARIIITLLAVVLLMAPVVVLFRQEESGAVKIAVILLFTLVFSAALAVFTKAKRHEVFSATAA
ncbi:hypothetical protein K490DRAFT_66718 [Saccharata proteae CBS 121410]|uniref:DUF6594 domain-containing protein n=1 Tax=Saccharata proteae CBS 121410 TaxID=1314787 RepID=A0A9P4HWH6_9PEZI|nr:hypothetical protein K490DRAFT_66718 [Saccharata proteae CBS 121410]